MAVKGVVKSFFAPLTDGDNWDNLKVNNKQTGKEELLYGINATGCCDLNCSWYLNHSDQPNIKFVD